MHLSYHKRDKTCSSDPDKACHFGGHSSGFPWNTAHPKAGYWSVLWRDCGELTQKHWGSLKSIPVFTAKGFRSLRLRTDIPQMPRWAALRQEARQNSGYNRFKAMYICLINSDPSLQAEGVTGFLAMKGGRKCRHSEGQECSSASDSSQCRSWSFFIPPSFLHLCSPHKPLPGVCSHGKVWREWVMLPGTYPRTC